MKIPEEDRQLAENLMREVSAKQGRTHECEWCDMYGGSGFRKGRPEVFLQSFYCKWCLRIRTKGYDGSQFNMNIPEDDLNEPDDGVGV